VHEHKPRRTVDVLASQLGGGVGTIGWRHADTSGDEAVVQDRPREAIRAEDEGGVAATQAVLRADAMGELKRKVVEVAAGEGAAGGGVDVRD